MLQFDTMGDAPEDLQKGRIVLVTDHEDRENEGDFIYAAQYVTTGNANFMAVHGKGLTCMSMSMKLCRRLEFPQMVMDNGDNHEAVFTVSVDHIGTTTGISAVERGVTARFCTDDHARPGNFHGPGHMFPLMARKNRVLEREGHMEVTVDLMRLTGLRECDLRCKVIKEDGIMIRTPELMDLTRKWGSPFIITQVIKDYHKRRGRLVEYMVVAGMPTRYGDFKVYGYVNRLNGEHHVVLVKGEIGDGCGLLCKVHPEYLAGDAFGSMRCDCGQQSVAVIERIEGEGRDVLLYMRQEGQGVGLIDKLRAYQLQD